MRISKIVYSFDEKEYPVLKNIADLINPSEKKYLPKKSEDEISFDAFVDRNERKIECERQYWMSYFIHDHRSYMVSNAVNCHLERPTEKELKESSFVAFLSYELVNLKGFRSFEMNHLMDDYGFSITIDGFSDSESVNGISTKVEEIINTAFEFFTYSSKYSIDISDNPVYKEMVVLFGLEDSQSWVSNFVGQFAGTIPYEDIEYNKGVMTVTFNHLGEDRKDKFDE